MKLKYSCEYIAKKLLIFSPLILVLGPLATDLSLILICFLFIYLKPVGFFSSYKFLIYIMFIYFLLMVLSSLINNQNLLYFFKTIAHVRFFIFPFAVIYFFKKYKDYGDFLKITKFCILFIVSDACLQYVTGHNILGFQSISPDRMSSFFNDELIMGSYILRITCFYLAFYFFLKKKNDVNILLLILISVFGVILSGERASIILILMIFSIYLITLIFNYKKNFIKLICIFFFFLISYFFLKPTLESRAKLTRDEFLGYDTPRTGVVLDNKYKIFGIFLVSQSHHNYFLVGTEMFKENILFGQGRGSFKYKSCEEKFKINSFSCSTHPHNTYIQLLAETGIFSFLIIFLFFLFILSQILKNIYLFYKKNKNLYLEKIYFIIPIFIVLFPFITTGSFYNNYINFFYSFSLGIYLMHLRKIRF